MIKIARIISFLFKYFFTLYYRDHVRFGKRVILNHRFRFRGVGNLTIGDDVNLWAHEEPNRFFTFTEDARIAVGNRCRVNGATFQCKTAIDVGDDCLLGSVMLIDTDFHAIEFEGRNDPDAIKSKPIHVGEKVWLCGQSAVLKGVTIGQRSVVGFRAVVTRDVPEKVIVAGNPAEVVRQLPS